ncbi:hypothetical protein SAMN06265222_1154 [Neorhodopirellula lusitana]|uniref:Uncharacterized protein n=1 Tax=Neorhodopirellula lusitana TaxID=445327 RepID=A0ABY1QI58_9BACT|nr:hypothetical protein SAMN06265222_1154 [Neorhodopirellula lusitana]
MEVGPSERLSGREMILRGIKIFDADKRSLDSQTSGPPESTESKIGDTRMF